MYIVSKIKIKGKNRYYVVDETTDVAIDQYYTNKNIANILCKKLNKELTIVKRRVNNGKRKDD